ncbi:MAG TPA: carboxypeptidase regulatory-like domain-containing protein [Opitutaceae bacterium]|nr:carboxypeptidase regulatory-like domain-containing protein [Opitutaceae bacterium]
MSYECSSVAARRRNFGAALARAIALGAALSCLAGLAATPASTGTIQGRVVNGANGNYLSKARITVEGTAIETFTDDYGNYTLLQVPAGTDTLHVTYTGQAPLSASVNVAADGTTNQDFIFNREQAAATTGEGKVVKLNQFVVQSERYQSAEQIAVNEQRYSVNLKDVVAADTFGHVAKGNVGEFVKFLPGIQVQYGGTYINPADAAYISVRGYGPDNTAITIDGVPVSNPSPASLSRAVGLDMLTINNASRVEVIKVPTPDMPSNSAGGSVNLITKSAFEYALPQTTIDLHVGFNSKDAVLFRREAGPANKKTYHTLPSGSISFVKPFSKTLGVTVTATSENNYTPSERAQESWTYTPVSYDLTSVGGVKGNLTNSAGNISDLAHPFLKTASVTDNPWNTFQRSVSARVDWKPTPNQLIQANTAYSDYDGIQVSRKLGYTIQTPQDWGPDFVTGINYPTGTKLANPKETANMQVQARDKQGFTTSAYINYHYNRGSWRIGALASWSMGYGTYKDIENKHFSEVDMVINAGQIAMSGIHDGLPSNVVVKDRSGNVIDTTKLANWGYDGFSAQSGIAHSRDTEVTYKGDLERDFDFSRFSLTAKAGFERDLSKQSKWGRGTGYKMAYDGPALDPTQFLDTSYSRSPGFGWPQQQWVDTYKVYSLYQAHPEYFNPNDPGVVVGNYNSYVNQQKAILETKDAYYGMITGRFFNNRLTVVAGARKQSSKEDGRGPWTDSKWNFLKNPNGTLYVDPVLNTTIRIDQASSPLFSDTALQSRLTQAGVSFPNHVVANPNTNLEARMRQLVPMRAIHQKVSSPAAPMIAMSYNITSNLVFKPSWGRTTTMPSYENSTAGILSGNGAFSINENYPHNDTLGGDGVISVANPGLLPQKTDSYQAALEYYTRNGGTLRASYFYNITKNAWITTDVYNINSEYASVLQGMGLTPSEFENWDIRTTINGDASSTNRGYELSAIQNLGILGRWGQHFDVFGNYSRKLMHPSTKPGVISFTDSSNDTWAGGVRFNIQRFSLSVRATSQSAVVTKGSAPAVKNAADGKTYQLYQITPKILKMDVEADYLLSKRWSLYLTGSNVLNTRTLQRQYDVSNIVPDYARLISDYRYGVVLTAGVTARF